MARVGKVGSDNNRALSVVGQSLIIGALAGNAHYLIDDQKVHRLSVDTFDFAADVGGEIEKAISESSVYKRLKNGLKGYIGKAEILEQPVKKAEDYHKGINKRIGNTVGPLRQVKQTLEWSMARLGNKISVADVIENQTNEVNGLLGELKKGTLKGGAIKLKRQEIAKKERIIEAIKSAMTQEEVNISAATLARRKGLEIDRIVNDIVEMSGAKASSDAFAEISKTLGAMDYISLKQGAKNTKGDIKNVSSQIAKKVNMKTALIVGGVIAIIAATVSFSLDAKKKNDAKYKES